MVIKLLRKLLNYLESKKKFKSEKKVISSDELEFIEKQKRIKRDFQKMMNYDVHKAIGKKER